MLYKAYELQRAMLTGASVWASLTSELLSSRASPLSWLGLGPVMGSALDVFAHAAAPRGKPAFDIESVSIDGAVHSVTEAIVLHRPFGNLLRFTHDGLLPDAPKVLIVAPMSGHYATLLRGTVARMVERATVYITDWADAKMVPVEAGSFDLDDYIDYVIDFLEFTGPNTHVIAVCQPSVPALAATALMGAAEHPCRPATLTMMGGPIDTREAPTQVNATATGNPLSWFQNNLIATVPALYPGEGRKVYPGFLQLAGFMWQNIELHMKSHYQMFEQLVAGDGESADASKAFYDEYRSVCDMTAEFYLQTVEHVFQRHSLPKGELVHRGQRVDLGAIRDTAILAVEGENDDISGIGQTKAALTLATSLSDSRKKYHLAAEVGHYGIFNGSKWRTRIAPVVEEWIARHDKARLKVVA
ncbi:polyhydroxyalkanoate depolymerase [Novosphingobium sp. G106]|uniref:polyhydroxyalkanoate depolymerase n=1 Tax=Novosphingobium sp. G106 TaxID=2849500 RepID=UPI0020C5ADB8|nr:polyhydroxyalkanoate depolymerase [Novosphingobium sp. G106]